MSGPPEDRASGVLLHVTSLPSVFGIGDLGPEACRWIDFLTEAGQRWWQVLPLNPTNAAGSDSPYLSASALAGNPLLVSPELLCKDGLLDQGDIASALTPADDRVDFAHATSTKLKLLDRAFERFRGDRPVRAFVRFCETHASWLDDHCLFTALVALEGPRWAEWPAALRGREVAAITKAREDLADAIDRERFRQWVFYDQWQRLKDYANERGVRIIGDVPFYTGYEAVDVWSHQTLFKLDASGQPLFVAGVPPDAFSDTGQLWNNPVFDWDAHEREGFTWWLARFAHNLGWFDRLRIDHFRGFAAHWEVPAGADTAAAGRWTDGPGSDLLDAVFAVHPTKAFVAEDLGVITDDVRELIRRYGLAAMNVLLFAFDTDNSCYLPHNHERHSVVYTGTHDNNTVHGWFEGEADPTKRQRLERYVGHECDARSVNWDFVRLAMSSVADVSIVPMQDLLGLSGSARMNRPGTNGGNWQWRMRSGQASSEIASRMAALTATYGRG